MREAVEETAGEAPSTLPPALPPRTPQAVPSETLPPEAPAPLRPDNTAVNTLWSGPTAPLRGGIAARWRRRLLGPVVDAQVAFNSRQVQLDNEILDYVDARLATTHGHYDAVLGILSRHLAEIDERHLILQEELVAHVHDLVRRIDLVLGESDRGRISLERALRDLRGRLTQLEERLAEPPTRG